MVDGVDQVIYEGGSTDTVRGTPYLNPAAFALQPISLQGVPTRIGTAPPQLSVRGPALYTEDFGLFKRFTAGGSRNVEFRADFINVLNRSGLGASGPRCGERELRADLRRRAGTTPDPVVAAPDVLTR